MGAEIRTIEGREVRFRDSTSDICVITFYADFDEKSIDGLIDSLPDVKVAALKIDDWNQELSPWKADPVFSDQGFGEGAGDTLSFITDRIIPGLGCKRYVIGGYSLAGLFSLWACYRSDKFAGCCAASPSVWFPGWDEFIDKNEFQASKAYLSMGDREARTRNQLMSKVADRIVLQKERIIERIGPENTVLEWNKGGHFQDVTDRTRRAFLWVLDRL